MPVSELETYKLAFDQASKGLTSQVATVDNARARIGLLMGGGNLATAFLGKDAIAKAFDGEAVNLLFWFGAGAYVLFALACIWGLWPRGAWVFSLSAASIIDRHVRTVPETIESTYRWLAEWAEHHFDANAVRLDTLFLAIRVASVLVLVELATFLVVLGGAKWLVKI
jgi:hypothetical protein